MNCIQSFIDHAYQFPEQPALWNQGEGMTNFGQIYNYAAETQNLTNRYGAQKGDYALIFGKPSAALYSAVIGLLGLGCSVIFIEPWMSISEIEQVIADTSPKLYVTTLLGRFWGMRVKAIRKIPFWISLNRIKNHSGFQKLSAVDLPEMHIGFITFTTGTTGGSKGVVRTHGVLYHQCKVLSKQFLDQEGPDLCVLPNFVLLNMALGKSSVFVSSSCSRRDFQKIPKSLKPSGVSCGPGFLKKLVENADCFSELSSFHIGGALAECSLYEKGIEKWPKAKWVQIYGSSEAEPVAIADIREVLKNCKDKPLHQTLYLGHPISELEIYFENDLLWVSGNHVSPSYARDPVADKTNKKKDALHRVWHQMGDRIFVDEKGWWYRGRSAQSLSDFSLEQEISTFLKTNAVLIASHEFLLGKGVKPHREELLKKFPSLKDVIECEFYWDRRHQARIDREKTIKKGAPWIDG
jgi:acyl-coenzyme A synthetase/AMP-(fatty) acid ligase